MKKFAVLGAGISGLSTAYWLKKNNFDAGTGISVLLDSLEEGRGI